MRAFEQRKKNMPASTAFFGPKIQKKLKTGTVGDHYEVEADKVADKVVNKNSSGGLVQSKSEEEIQQKSISESITSVQAKDMKEEEPVQKKDKEEEKPVQKKDKEEEKPVQKKEEKEEPIQAKCADCEKEDKVQKKDKKEEEKPVQKKEKNTASEIQDNELEGKLNTSKGSGSGLDKSTKKEMESGFGADFSNVKIHTDARAVQMSQELGAQAFTTGNDVYFNDGKYNPDSKEGKHLLAHELTHTIQQTGAVQKSGTIQKSAIENHPDDLRAKQPENPQFEDNVNLEKANDNEMLVTTGQKGPAIAELQKGLLRAGQSLPNFGVDGDFGSETRNAVMGFQSDAALNSVDGIVGPETIGALDNLLIEQKGGGNGGSCATADSVVGIDKDVAGERSVGFFSTKKCPKIRVVLDITAFIVDSHFCSSFEISIDHVKSTEKTIQLDNNGKGKLDETFTMKNHKDKHNLFLTMPVDCRGLGDKVNVKGSLRRI
jgi:hypothetical protein